jgi:hypothetical protein
MTQKIRVSSHDITFNKLVLSQANVSRPAALIKALATRVLRDPYTSGEINWKDLYVPVFAKVSQSSRSQTAYDPAPGRR